MSNKVTVSVTDIKVSETNWKTDLASVSCKYTIRRGGKIVERDSFKTNLSGRRLRRLRSMEATGQFADIEQRATRRAVESLILSCAIDGTFHTGDVVTIKAKRDIAPLRRETIAVIADTVGCEFVVG